MVQMDLLCRVIVGIIIIIIIITLQRVEWANILQEICVSDVLQSLHTDTIPLQGHAIGCVTVATTNQEIRVSAQIVIRIVLHDNISLEIRVMRVVQLLIMGITQQVEAVIGLVTAVFINQAILVYQISTIIIRII